MHIYLVLLFALISPSEELFKLKSLKKPGSGGSKAQMDGCPGMVYVTNPTPQPPVTQLIKVPMAEPPPPSTIVIHQPRQEASYQAIPMPIQTMVAATPPPPPPPTPVPMPVPVIQPVPVPMAAPAVASAVAPAVAAPAVTSAVAPAVAAPAVAPAIQAGVSHGIASHSTIPYSFHGGHQHSGSVIIPPNGGFTTPSFTTAGSYPQYGQPLYGYGTYGTNAFDPFGAF